MDIAVLRDLSTRQEVRRIRKNYDERQLNDLRMKHSEVSISRAEEEERWDALKTEHRGIRRELEAEARAMLGDIRMGGSDVKIECLCVPDFDRGMMNLHDPVTGELLLSEPLRPEDRQDYIPGSGRRASKRTAEAVAA